MTTTRTIRCGNCKQTHNTVAEVRECFGRPYEPPITAGQRNFAQALLREHEPPDEYADMSEDRINQMSKAEASQFIGRMKQQPYRRKAKGLIAMLLEDPYADVAEGYYAVRAADGKVDFFKIVDSQHSRKMFQVYGSPGALAENPVTRPELANAVLSVIAQDQQAAMLLFGTELGMCGACGSPLTNDESREIGIGPVCRRKRGW